MTQEEEQLLLKDLCARLTYGVKCNAFLKQIDGSLKSIFGEFKGYNRWANIGNNLVDIETVKPYLRPMSSMTEEEYKEYDKATDLDVADSGETLKANLNAKARVRVSKWYHGNDWLNAHHFDYRGLIPKGLALEAPEGMYNI